MDPQPGGEFVQSLARGLAVIRAFDGEHPHLTLSELAARADLTRATARRFLLTLVELGYVSSDGRDFRLTPQVLDLGFSYLASLSLPELVQPALERLSRETGESTSASVLDGTDIVYIARVSVQRIMTVGISIGTRFPAFATSMGRVLLAARSDVWLDEVADGLAPPALTPYTVTDAAEIRTTLARVRDQGWALVDQELERGLRAIAAPLHASDGTVIAAINVATTTASASLERMLEEFRPLLVDTAAQIDEAIGRSRM